jgi:hypothetical protein
MKIYDDEALQERINEISDSGNINGIDMALTSIETDHAVLEVRFFNANYLSNILNDTTTGTIKPYQVFPITGGLRLPAGPAEGQVKVISITQDDLTKPILVLRVEPIGDYSTYTLVVNSIGGYNFDPLFNEIEFKFRPGCFSTNCAPEWEPVVPAGKSPVIDYLARDYDSFRHQLMTWMTKRIPGWNATSEADLDQVLIELLSVAADELSDYQDRVMGEAYIATSRKRVSLARHARLLDYHIHQGNQADTWLAVQIADNADNEEFVLPAGSNFWTGESEEQPDDRALAFMTNQDYSLHYLLNEIHLYPWDGAVTGLKAGSTEADLLITEPDGEQSPSDLNKVIEDIQAGAVKYLLIQEWLNPADGEEAGRDSSKRQLLKLLTGPGAAEIITDPLNPDIIVLRVRWEEKDRLLHDYCFSVEYPDGPKDNISLFHGNLVHVYCGTTKSVRFKDPDALLGDNELHYETTAKWGIVCRLPFGPLLYRDTPPGGEDPPISTLRVTIFPSDGGPPYDGDEVSSLLHYDKNAFPFVVETDENGNSLLRFGYNGIGEELPEKAEVECYYQVGYGPDGNIGSDKIIHWENSLSNHDLIRCWNPFSVTNGRAPEPKEEIIRRVPEAYRSRQLRAITLNDYENRAEELPDVSRAKAYYSWTGSWRTVRVAIDPVGTTVLTDELREKIAGHLDAVRLIGEDLEIRPPVYIPLMISVSFCVLPGYWPMDIKYLLEQEFSDGFTSDGRKGFFHPDNWTFGQFLRKSQILGRIHNVQGVDHVVEISMARWNAATPGMATGKLSPLRKEYSERDFIEVDSNEIILVKNDPDHMEHGLISFYPDPSGGRQ